MNISRALALIFTCFSMILVTALPMAYATEDLLYVCNGGVGNISVVDLETNAEVASIDRPSMPSGTALSPDGSRLYVTGELSGKVYIIDTKTEGLVGTIDVGSGPYITLSADGSQACLMGDYGLAIGLKIKVINTSTQSVIAILPGGTRPRSAAFSPDGSTLYVADTGNNGIRALNISTGEVIRSITFPGTPVGLSMSPDGDHIYVAVISTSSMNRVYPTDCPTFTCCNPAFIIQSLIGWITGKETPGDTDAIYQINASDLSIESTISLGAAPVGYAAGPGDMVYVACDGGYGSYLYILNTSTKSVTDKIPVDVKFLYSRPPITMAVNPDGSRVLFSREYNNTITSVNIRSRVVTTVDLGNSHPDGISAGLSQAYVSSTQSNKVLAFNSANDTAMHTISQWWAPHCIALSPDGSRAYAISEIGNLVSVIDTNENRILSDIPVGGSPKAIAVSPDGSTVCVANYNNETVSVIDTYNDTVTRTLSAGRWPCGLTFSPDGSLLYVINQDWSFPEINSPRALIVTTGSTMNDSLYVFNAKTGGVERTAHVMNPPGGIAASPDGSRIYVTCPNATNSMAGNVLVMDAKDLSLIKTIDVGANPGGIALSPDGSRIYVIYSKDIMRKVAVIDTNTSTIVSDSIAPKNPFLQFIALSPDGSRLYVSDGNFVDGNVTVIDTMNYAATSTIMTGYSHGGMAVLHR